MKSIRQHDEQDCGATCLSMIATHYGLIYPIQKYRELTKTDRNGCNIYGIIDAAKNIGLDAEALSGTPQNFLQLIEQNELKFPLIAHIVTEETFLHFVVIEKYCNRQFVVLDPAKGRLKISAKDFFKIWSGYIITFNKSPNFKKGKHKRNSLIKFFNLLKGQYKFIFLILILSVFISAIGIFGAFVFEIVISNFSDTHEETTYVYDLNEDEAHTDSGNHDENTNIFLDNITDKIYEISHNFNLFFSMLILLYIFQACLQFVRGYLISLISKKLDIRLIIPYYNHLLDLPLNTIKSRNTGEYMSRLSDAATIRTTVSEVTLTLVLDSIMAIACGVMLYLKNKNLFYLSLISILIYTIVVLCYRNPLKKINRDIMEKNALVQSYLKESIDGIETIKVSCAESIAKKRNSLNFLKLVNQAFRGSIIKNSQDSICDSIEFICIAIILWGGFSMVINNAVSLGSLLTFYALLAYFTTPVKNLIELQPEIQTAVIAADRLNDVLESQAEESADYNSDTELSGINSISFKNIFFRYGNGNLTLDNVSMNIKKGDKIAIVGESGSGKTTLAKLLMRFYTQESGDIYINKKNILNFKIESIRSKISYVTQNPFMFSDTIKNNLLIANPSASDKDIDNVLKIVNADSFMSDLYLGYDTYLNENGSNLSGGQIQRLSIARALLKNPDLIILDEATSNLDPISEELIRKNLLLSTPNLTCIIIAHRLSMVTDCNKIYYIDKGKIAECGSHQELLNKKGLYFRQWMMQKSNKL